MDERRHMKVGDIHYNTKGKRCVVVETGSGVVTWAFDDGVIVTKTRGNVPCHPDDRKKAPFKVGDRVLSNFFGWVEVIEYKGSKKIRIVFEDGRTASVQAYALKLGQVTPQGSLRTNTEGDWISKAISIHGDKYDYTNSVFEAYDKPVKIYCRTCKEVFSVTATDHINKYQRGCHKCAKHLCTQKQVLPFSEFIERSGKEHKWKYFYDMPSYRGLGHSVFVVCPIHGRFKVFAGNHVKGASGCPECYKVEKSKQRFKDTAKEWLNNQYSLVCQSTKNLVWVKHNSCGTIFQKPLDSIITQKHLCPSCGISQISFEDFLNRAREVHGDEYQYEDYVAISKKVSLTHKTCGNTFTANASSHISGNYGRGVGCPYCASHGLSPSRDTRLYILSADNGYVKIGVTHQQVSDRLRQISKSTRKLGWVFYEVTSWAMSGEKAIYLEKTVHKHFSLLYRKPEEKFDGSCETYIGVNVSDAINYLQNILNSST